MREATDQMSADERKVLDDVNEHGVHVTFVGCPDNQPDYAYTVGLWHHYQQPEVVVFGLDPEVVGELFEAVADEADGGARFRGGEKHEGLLVGFAVRFLDADPARAAELCTRVGWTYEGEAVPMVQLVWPDKNKRWPWEDGVRQGFRDSQPLLGPTP